MVMPWRYISEAPRILQVMELSGQLYTHIGFSLGKSPQYQFVKRLSELRAVLGVVTTKRIPIPVPRL
jgi:hypothetical protein